MKLIVNTCLFLSFAGVALGARDWQDTIHELERKPLNGTNKKLLAIAYNNRAIELQQDSDWSQAETLMAKAMQFDPQGGYGANLAMIHLNHAAELYRQRESTSRHGAKHDQAKRYAQRALALRRDLPQAHLLIGDIEYENQRLVAARSSWEAVQRLDPEFPGLAKRLGTLTKESSVERRFQKRKNVYFDIRYQQDMDAKTAKALQLATAAARQLVGKDFGYRPRHRLVVLVYPQAAFRGLELGPHWASGRYDGKIRLPLDKNATEAELLVAVSTIFHEYTHALVHDLTKGNCPVWLNEGLAEVQQSKVAPRDAAVLRAARENGELLSLYALNEAFESSSTSTIRIAYAQSRSLSAFLLAKQGYPRLKRLLERCGTDVPFEIALRETCHLTTASLETRWKSWLSQQP